MNVLAGCEWSGAVRDAFREAGHNAWSCDLEGVDPAGKWSDFHLRGDLRRFLNATPDGERWDMLIAFPPCTYLCSSGLHWNSRRAGRSAKTEAALEFVRELMGADIDRIGIENPQGCIGTRIRPADQWIQPYEFGEDASKKTGLWLKNLPPLRPTERFPGRLVIHNGKTVERWSNQTDSGQNILPPSSERAALRGKTYTGIAIAMAQQWGGLCREKTQKRLFARS